MGLGFWHFVVAEIVSRITAMRAGSGRDKKVRVFLDDRKPLTLPVDEIARHQMRIGQELSESQMAALADSARYHRCLQAAYRLLAHRPRSESEIRTRLNERDFGEAAVDRVITRLKEQELIDDVAFARLWKEDRDAFSPRSRWLIGMELLRKGVTPEIVDAITHDADDLESACRAASGKAARLSGTDYEVFRRRLGDHLKRRGFGYGVINETVKRLWRERETVSDPQP